jgi:hypothetical protein
MERIFRKWKATRARQSRLASLCAKCSETMFWLIMVGPFVVPRPMTVGMWCICAVGFVVMATGSYWYTIKSDGRSN